MLSDLDFVISVELDSHNLPFITPWASTIGTTVRSCSANSRAMARR